MTQAEAQSEGRPPGMAGDNQGPRLKRAMGQEKSTEGSRDLMTFAVLMCVHAGGREPQGGMHSWKRGGRPKKKTPQHHRRAYSTERAGSGGTGRSKQADERTRVARENKKTTATTGDQVGKRHGYRGKRRPGRRTHNGA